MNAPARLNSTPRLEDFPYRLTDNVRFADLDPNQHVNNAVYATYFETGRVTLMKDRSYGLMPPGLGWMLVRLDIHFRAELRWPGTDRNGARGCEVRPNFRDVRSGGVFGRQMRGVGAIGDSADRREHAQTDAADTRDRQEFSALAAPRRGNRAAEVLERFRARWVPGRVRKTRQHRNSRPAAPASRPRDHRVRRSP